jgi:predicted outer membrane protein
MTRKIHDSSGIRDATSEELAEINAREKEWSDNSSNRKLELIKEYRLQKLQETDWWVLRGNMSEAQTTYRQALRDIPQNFSTEEQYDLLLARHEETGELTHSIWSKP